MRPITQEGRACLAEVSRRRAVGGVLRLLPSLCVLCLPSIPSEAPWLPGSFSSESPQSASPLKANVLGPEGCRLHQDFSSWAALTFCSRDHIWPGTTPCLRRCCGGIPGLRPLEASSALPILKPRPGQGLHRGPKSLMNSMNYTIDVHQPQVLTAHQCCPTTPSCPWLSQLTPGSL